MKNIKKIVRIMMMVVVAVCMAGCGDKDHITVEPAELYGYWQQENSLYFWTFNADRTGNLVNRGEVLEGDEDNGDFTWVINDGDQLEVEFRGSGELGGIDIVKLYTLKEVTSETVKWEDMYGRVTRLIKRN